MDIIKALSGIGVSSNEACVYKALLEIGDGSVTDIARISSLKRPSVYLALEKLQLLGLVAETKYGKRKIYTPAHPRRLLQIAQLRQQRVVDTMSELVALYKEKQSRPNIQVFTGAEGVRQVYKELFESLNTQHESLWFTRIDVLRSHSPVLFDEFKKTIRQIKNPRIRELNYGNTEGLAWQKEVARIKGKNHYNKVLPIDFEFGFTDNVIYQNKIAIFTYEKNLFVTIIENQEVVKTFRALFEWAWLQGK